MRYVAFRIGFGRSDRFHCGGSTQVISTGGRLFAGEGAAVGIGAVADGLGSGRNGDAEPVGSGVFLHETMAKVARRTARFTVVGV
jgi:hypothetical protein